MRYTVSQFEVLRRLHIGLSPFYTAKIAQIKVQFMNCSKTVKEATIHATFSMHGQITMLHSTNWLSTSIFRGLYLDRSIWQNIASLARHHLCCTTSKSDNNCFDLPNRIKKRKNSPEICISSLKSQIQQTWVWWAKSTLVSSNEKQVIVMIYI